MLGAHQRVKGVKVLRNDVYLNINLIEFLYLKPTIILIMGNIFVSRCKV